LKYTADDAPVPFRSDVTNTCPDDDTDGIERLSIEVLPGRPRLAANPVPDGQLDETTFVGVLSEMRTFAGAEAVVGMFEARAK